MTKRLILMNEANNEIVRYTEVPRRPDMMEVEFRSGELVQIPLNAWVEMDLKIGMQVDGALLGKLRTEAVCAEAKSSALRFLNWKSRTTHEVQAHLQKSFPESVCSRVVADLVRLELLDDVLYARMYVEQKKQTFSRRELSWKLEQRGISRLLIQSVLEEMFPRESEAETARIVAEKFDRKQAHLSVQKRRQRLGNYLQRHGFAPALVRNLVFAVVKSDSDNQGFLDND